MNCQKSDSEQVIKYSLIHYKKQIVRCNECGSQFVENITNKVISSDIRQIIDNLLLERVSLKGIGRVTGVSLKWLQSYGTRNSGFC